LPKKSLARFCQKKSLARFAKKNRLRDFVKRKIASRFFQKRRSSFWAPLRGGDGFAIPKHFLYAIILDDTFIPSSFLFAFF